MNEDTNEPMIRSAESTRSTWRYLAPSRPTSESVYESLVKAYMDDVWRFVAARLPRKEDAEDVTMEVFGAAFRKFGTLRRTGDPLVWLLGIARHKVAEAHRKRYRRNETSLEDAGDHPAPSAEDHRLDLSAIDDLSDLHRDVLILKYVNGLSTEDIARVIGKSPEAANSLLQRARAAVRHHVKPETF